MDTLNQLAAAFANLMWGKAMLFLLVGGGVFFTVYSRMLPFRYVGHAIDVLRGKFDKDPAPGQLTHGQALSAALSGTVGMGNIAGVALAISVGGPGSVFWMWVSALVGVSTKFFTCTLGVMYRGKDDLGDIQGGPMYVIAEGLGPRWRPFAMLFAVAGLFGTMPAFQANQLTATVRDELVPASWAQDPALFNWVFAVLLATLVASVILGGLERVASVASKLVPTMAVSYFLMTLVVLLNHLPAIPGLFASIFTEAFAPSSVAGGLVGVMLIGVSRGAFSNEAGVGTEVLAHGAAKTNEPVREGLVGMLGPVIDTLLICTCTALAILAAGNWRDAEGLQGVSMTMDTFGQELGQVGLMLLGLQVFIFAATTMFTYWYYGEKCFAFIAGARNKHHYKWFYLAMILMGCTFTVSFVFNFMVGVYAIMAIPTMVSSLLLAPKVMAEARRYFASL